MPLDSSTLFSTHSHFPYTFTKGS